MCFLGKRQDIIVIHVFDHIITIYLDYTISQYGKIRKAPDQTTVYTNNRPFLNLLNPKHNQTKRLKQKTKPTKKRMAACHVHTKKQLI